MSASFRKILIGLIWNQKKEEIGGLVPRETLPFYPNPLSIKEKECYNIHQPSGQGIV